MVFCRGKEGLRERLVPKCRGGLRQSVAPFVAKQVRSQDEPVARLTSARQFCIICPKVSETRKVMESNEMGDNMSDAKGVCPHSTQGWRDENANKGEEE